MLLKHGKYWAGTMWVGRQPFAFWKPPFYKTINGIALGTSNAPPNEEQIGVQGTSIWDSEETYTIAKWNSTTMTVSDGPSRVPAFGFNAIVVDAEFDTYQLADKPVLREVVLFANYDKKADGFVGWPVSPQYLPALKYPYFPIARFVVNPITIDAGDTLTITWVLEFKDDQNDA